MPVANTWGVVCVTLAGHGMFPNLRQANVKVPCCHLASQILAWEAKEGSRCGSLWTVWWLGFAQSGDLSRSPFCYKPPPVCSPHKTLYNWGLKGPYRAKAYRLPILLAHYLPWGVPALSIFAALVNFKTCQWKNWRDYFVNNSHSFTPSGNYLFQLTDFASVCGTFPVLWFHFDEERRWK